MENIAAKKQPKPTMKAQLDQASEPQRAEVNEMDFAHLDMHDLRDDFLDK